MINGGLQRKGNLMFRRNGLLTKNTLPTGRLAGCLLLFVAFIPHGVGAEIAGATGNALYVAPDGKVSIDGDLDVGGDLTVTGKLVPSDYVKRLQCGGRQYACSSGSNCVSLCIQNKGRIAYKHEVFAIALKGGNHCAAGWFWNIASGKAEKGYPMYNYQGSDCANTSHSPIMAGWSDSTADCFCTLER